jgi:acetate---CoA ligase (ADP-forming)
VARLAPLSEDDARGILDDFADLGMLNGVRGGVAWDRNALVGILEAEGRLVAGGRWWIESIDINPLMLTPAGVLAVDASCFTNRDVLNAGIAF